MFNHSKQHYNARSKPRHRSGLMSRDGSRRRRVEALEHKRLMAADLAALSDTHADHHHDFDEVSYDACGRAFYFDPAPSAIELAFDLDLEAATLDPVAAISVVPIANVDEVPLLHSNPDATQKIFLDFDGHVVRNTGWNEENDDLPITARAFDNDGDPDTFSRSEVRAIERIFARVAEDYAPFDIDVTTESPPSSTFRAGRTAIRVLISNDVDQTTGNRWFEGAGGVAYINSWRFRNDTPVWVFEDNLGGSEKRIAEAISHEVGHALGLSHDGVEQGTDYYEGHGSGQTGWAPIMGAAYSKQLTQWSVGDYEDGNNSQDDLRIITSAGNQIRYRTDDHQSSFRNATMLFDTEQQIIGNGLIHRSSDQDMFQFDAVAGKLVIDIDPAQRGAANLDIEATLFDEDQNVVAVSNPTSRLDASFDLEVDGGTYYLQIDGVGNGDSVSGYTDYASIGQYSIEITVPFVAEVPLIAGDVDGDGVVDFQDFLMMASNFQETNRKREDGDVDGDGQVQFSDFLIISAHYGKRADAL